jgi:serine/threonine protein kinase
MIKECTIIRELARGGQKTVYLAKHQTKGLVVIKRGPIKSLTSMERIKREVELLSDLQSEYYPTQYHFNIDLRTKEFEIVEDYIVGTTLRASMQNYNDPRSIFTLMNQLEIALKIIWDRNVVHRDLKPENIIIRANGNPCIIDLGIARFLDLDELTKTMAPMGPCTPIYAAPEQLSNHKNLIDHRTDFFNLGLIALELYLGAHPFDPAYVGNGYSIVENITNGIYISETGATPRNVGLSEFASKTLALQPYMRFRNFRMLNDFTTNHI